MDCQIFISYKRVNKNQVFHIVKQIEELLGVKCWVDLDGIESSAQFASVICKAIDSSEIVLFMHSSVHLNIDFDNDWTIKELNYAQAKKKRVVLVKLDSSPLDNVFLLNYGSKNNIDSRDQIQFRKLISDLRKWLKIPQNKTHSENSFNKSSEALSNNMTPKSNLSDNTIFTSAFSFNFATPEEQKLCNTYIDMIIHKKGNFSDTRKRIEALAEKGLTEAEYALGLGEWRPYNTNIRLGGDTHYRLAEQWLVKAAKKGHIKAQASLSEMYYWGKELEKAIQWATIATKKGNPDAARTLAWCYRDLKDDPNYVETIRKAAQLQESTRSRDIHSPALEYGNILLEGKMIKQNLNEAIRWFDIAISLAYDYDIESDALYSKAQALYKQGHRWKALRCLNKCKGVHNQWSVSKLYDTIVSELNPLSKLFTKKQSK